jgi:hypothetical protein
MSVAQIVITDNGMTGVVLINIAVYTTLVKNNKTPKISLPATVCEMPRKKDKEKDREELNFAASLTN